jgi:hypothetical protein
MRDFKDIKTLQIMLCTENPIHVFSEMKLRGLVPQFPHSYFCERFIYSQDRSAYLTEAK